MKKLRFFYNGKCLLEKMYEKLNKITIERGIKSTLTILKQSHEWEIWYE